MEWAELVAEATGSRFSPETARRAMEGVPSLESGPEAVLPFLDRLGVSVQTLHVTAEEARDIIGPRHPILWWNDEGEGPPELWVKRRGRRAKAVAPGVRPHWRRPLDTEGRTVAWAIAPEPILKDWPKVGALRRLWALLDLERADLQMVGLYAFITGALTLTTPLAVQALISTLRLGTLLQPLAVLAILLVSALSLLAVVRTLEVHVVEMMQRRLLVRLASDLAHRLVRADRDDLQARRGGPLMNRFFEIFLLHKTLAYLLLDGLDLVLRTILGMILLAVYHPLLLGFDFVLITALGLLLFWPSRKGISTGIYESKAKHALVEWLEQVANENSVFRSSAGQQWSRDRIDAHARQFMRCRQEHFRVVIIQTIGGLSIQALASGALLGLGGWLVMQGQLTLGQLVASELILAVVVSSIAKLGKHIEGFYDLVASSDKVGELLDLQMMTDKGTVPSADAPLTLSAHDLAVVRRDRVLAKKLRFQWHPGSRVALLGPSGAGKSTIVDALFDGALRAEGRFELAGVDVGFIDPTWYNDRLVILRPQGWVEGTVEDNVRLGRPLDRAELERIFRAVGLEAAIAILPKGVETEIDNHGHPLSHGEAVALLVARAIAQNARIVVVDGLFDALDRGQAFRLLNALHGGGRRTVVLCTHDEARAKWAQEVLRIGEASAQETTSG